MPSRLMRDLMDFTGENFLKDLRSRRILVTGATGLIGSSVIKALVQAAKTKDLDIRITAVIRDQTKADRIFKDTDLSLVTFKILDMNGLKATDIPDSDYVIHCASITESRAFVEHPAEVIETSVNGTKALLEYARLRKVSGFVYLSTMEVYGNPGKGIRVTEDQACAIDPSKVRSSYPLSKMMCENLCICYASEFKIPVKIARLTQTFGPGVSPADSRLYAYFAKCAIEGSDIVLNTRGETERCYCYLADAVTAIITLLLKGEAGEVYNVATDGTYCSVADMAEMVASRYGINVTYDLKGASGKGFADTLYIDLNTDKLRSLGWRSQDITILDMIDSVVESLREDVP